MQGRKRKEKYVRKNSKHVPTKQSKIRVIGLSGTIVSGRNRLWRPEDLGQDSKRN